ncbi:MAG: gfo/Idh/MocA family oxidoreductase, partial [Clostridia bacterium]|nr:gfo/Idh/MocA family oxidoreductase [Clostridia bacterium]
MLRMGFIGQGGITSVHYAGYRNLNAEGFEISIDAIADIRPEMLEKHDAPHKYADYNELLEAEVGKLDFVDICLPTFL